MEALTNVSGYICKNIIVIIIAFHGGSQAAIVANQVRVIFAKQGAGAQPDGNGRGEGERREREKDARIASASLFCPSNRCLK